MIRHVVGSVWYRDRCQRPGAVKQDMSGDEGMDAIKVGKNRVACQLWIQSLDMTGKAQ
jgi:hypothetical protein